MNSPQVTLTPKLAVHHTVKPRATALLCSDISARRPTKQGLPSIDKRHHALSVKCTDRVFKYAQGIGRPLDASKVSVKDNGIIQAYAANTHAGNIRPYNEDKVSIVYNLAKTSQGSIYPNASFFAVFDGHGGASCAEFLRDHLHQFLVKDPNFPARPKDALRAACAACEQAFTAKAVQHHERAGSCAIVVLVMDTSCYVANVGDSRAILSGEGGVKSYSLSKDHKPGEASEKARILQAGGKIYQTPGFNNVLGPTRLLPGRLSVSRSFGDIEAKLPEFGGNPLALTAQPDVKAFRIQPTHDFIFIGSDGVFDKLSNRDIIQLVWKTCRNSRGKDLHQVCGEAVETVLRAALDARTLDNITGVLIFLTDMLARRPVVSM